MKTIQQKIELNFRYDVAFTHQAFSKENDTLLKLMEDAQRESIKVIIYIDNGFYELNAFVMQEINNYFLFHKNIQLVCNPQILIGGEETKNRFSNIEKIYSDINKHKICRHSYIIAIGGGAFIDMVGFAAATAHRGIRLIRMPTTVLAQNDAGMGVKNGVNWFGKKNFIGSFATPYAVVNDFNFLQSLHERDWRSGIAEALKVALIKDKYFFHFIKDNTYNLMNRKHKSMEYLIERCAELHLDHIANNGDPFEMTSARPLDFGHWSAHKLESLSHYRLKHGEAVAIGICLDSIYSYLTNTLDKESLLTILKVFQEIGFEMWTPEMETLNQFGEYALFDGLHEFKEHLGGELSISLLTGLGSSYEIHEVNIDLYKQAFSLLKNITISGYEALEAA